MNIFNLFKKKEEIKPGSVVKYGKKVVPVNTTGRKKIEVPKNYRKLFMQAVRGEITHAYAMKSLNLKRGTYYRIARDLGLETGTQMKTLAEIKEDYLNMIKDTKYAQYLEKAYDRCKMSIKEIDELITAHMDKKAIVDLVNTLDESNFEEQLKELGLWNASIGSIKNAFGRGYWRLNTFTTYEKDVDNKGLSDFYKLFFSNFIDTNENFYLLGTEILNIQRDNGWEQCYNRFGSGQGLKKSSNAKNEFELKDISESTVKPKTKARKRRADAITLRDNVGKNQIYTALNKDGAYKFYKQVKNLSEYSELVKVLCNYIDFEKSTICFHEDAFNYYQANKNKKILESGYQFIHWDSNLHNNDIDNLKMVPNDVYKKYKKRLKVAPVQDDVTYNKTIYQQIIADNMIQESEQL